MTTKTESKGRGGGEVEGGIFLSLQVCLLGTNLSQFTIFSVKVFVAGEYDEELEVNLLAAGILG